MATQAGVAVSTVSRVLNNNPRVAGATRAKVLTAIDLLDYTPNPMAQGLSKGRCQTLGVVVPFFTHASAVERLRGVVEVLDRSRYDLVLFNVESPLHRDEHFATLTRRDRADGLLVTSLPPPPDDLRRLAEARVPVVLLDARGEGVPLVTTDDVEGGRIATRHLLELGHERVAFIGDEPQNPLGFTSSRDRERGFRETMAEAGLPVPDAVVRHGPHIRTVARGLAGGILARPPSERPTAVFAASDTQALGVLEAARAQGLDVPEDLSVIGFDDVEVSSYAGLTTVRQPLYESGQRAAALLLEALDAHELPEPAVHRLGLELVIRATTGAPGRSRSGQESLGGSANDRDPEPEQPTALTRGRQP